MLKSILEMVLALSIIILISPLLISIAILIKLDSTGPIFFFQNRVGLNGKIFKIIKFRTMYVHSYNKSVISEGETDKRITRIGKYIRKFHLDELIQFLNVLKGDMSFVGPRPEITKFIHYYPELWHVVLSIKPGITSNTALNLSKYEYKTLANVINVEEIYISKILPIKLKSDIEYVKKRNLYNDLKIIFLTFLRMIGLNYKVRL